MHTKILYMSVDEEQIVTVAKHFLPDKNIVKKYVSSPETAYIIDEKRNTKKGYKDGNI